MANCHAYWHDTHEHDSTSPEFIHSRCPDSHNLNYSTGPDYDRSLGRSWQVGPMVCAYPFLVVFKMLTYAIAVVWGSLGQHTALQEPEHAIM